MKLGKILSVLIAGAVTASMLPTAFASTSEGFGDNVVYSNDFSTESSDVVFNKQAMQSTAAYENEQYKVELNEGKGPINNKTVITFNSTPVDTRKGVVTMEFKTKMPTLSSFVFNDRFATVKGYNEDGTEKNIGGFYPISTKLVYPVNWNISDQGYEKASLYCDKWVTYKITINKADNYFKHEVIGENGILKASSGNIANTAIPDFVSGVINTFNTGNVLADSTANSILYFDDFVIRQYPDVVYMNDFSQNTGYSFNKNATKATIEQVSGGSIEIQVHEENGPKSNNAEFNMNISNPVETAKSVILMEFKVNIKDLAASAAIDRFATVTGELSDGTAKNIEGLYRYGGKLIAPQDWTNLGSKPYVNLSDMQGEEYATYRIIVNKQEGWWSHSVYDASGALKTTTGKQTSTNLPDKITGVNWNFYIGDFKTGDNTKYNFDDFRVYKLSAVGEEDNSYSQSFDSAVKVARDVTTTGAAQLVSDTAAKDAFALKVTQKSSASYTDVNWDEVFDTTQSPVTIDTRVKIDYTSGGTYSCLNTLSNLRGYNVTDDVQTAASMYGLYDGGSYYSVAYVNDGRLQISSGAAYDKIKAGKYVTMRQIVDGRNQTYWVGFSADDGESFTGKYIQRQSNDGTKTYWTVPQYLNASRIGMDGTNSNNTPAPVYIDSINVTQQPMAELSVKLAENSETSANDADATFTYGLQEYSNGVNVYVAAYDSAWKLLSVKKASSTKTDSDEVTAVINGVPAAAAYIKAFV